MLKLDLQISGRWASLYRFNRPFEVIDFNQTATNFRNMMTYNGMLPIRDVYVKASILTDNGRIGFYIEPKKTISSAYKFVDDNGVISKKFYEAPNEFIEDLSSVTGLKTPEALLAVKKGSE